MKYKWLLLGNLLLEWLKQWAFLYWREMELRNFYPTANWNTHFTFLLCSGTSHETDFACVSCLAPKNITSRKSKGKVLLFFNVRDQIWGMNCVSLSLTPLSFSCRFLNFFPSYFFVTLMPHQQSFTPSFIIFPPNTLQTSVESLVSLIFKRLFYWCYYELLSPRLMFRI